MTAPGGTSDDSVASSQSVGDVSSVEHVPNNSSNASDAGNNGSHIAKSDNKDVVGGSVLHAPLVIAVVVSAVAAMAM